ncbi:DUF6168 family protein [uncultured Algibacter sp.]|uniref:DUF6168 family protein n=1 Tax=uncultured Algibacter sp. TaxID=298659 RepID=UPI00260860B8|nr:DUF6168 family protein [uncultured Algibacter sp.]
MTLKKLITNCLTVIFVASIAFFIHLFINSSIANSVEFSQLFYSYWVNVLLACGVIVLLFMLRKRLKDQLGFIFMAASMLKFVFFFFLFYPEYNSDGDLSRLEFLTFFIPYVVCLIIESIILSKFLNSLDNYN